MPATAHRPPLLTYVLYAIGLCLLGVAALTVVFVLHIPPATLGGNMLLAELAILPPVIILALGAICLAAGHALALLNRIARRVETDSPASPSG